MRTGVDFAFGYPGNDGAPLAAQGMFVGRYVPYQGDQGKGLRPIEVADYRANGVDFFLFWQTTADYILGGYDLGRRHAQVCLAATADLGLDDSGAFYFVADFDAQASHHAAIANYLRGVATVLPLSRIGFYGHDRVCAFVASQGLATYFCQTLAWSGNRVFAGRNLHQATDGSYGFNGHSACREDAYTTDFGQWKSQEEEMGMSDNDILAVFGSTEPDAVARLTAAKYRYQQAIDTGHSPFDVAAQSQSETRDHVNNHAAGVTGAIPEHKHEQGKVAR